MTEALGLGRLPFTFAGLVVGSLCYSLPFVVQPLQNAFEAIGPAPAGSGGGPSGQSPGYLLPRGAAAGAAGFVTAAILGFAHTVGVGEFAWC